jgi:hypothetical protein
LETCGDAGVTVMRAVMRMSRRGMTCEGRAVVMTVMVVMVMP